MVDQSPAVAEDDSLIADLWADHPEALERLARAYGGSIFNIALRVTGSAADAEDVAQETLVRAWRALPPSGPLRLRAWLATVTTRLALNELRRRGRHPAVPIPATTLDRAGPRAAGRDAFADSNPLTDPYQTAAARLSEQVVLGALAGLPGSLRAAMLLRAVHDLEYDEIGAVLCREAHERASIVRSVWSLVPLVPWPLRLPALEPSMVRSSGHPPSLQPKRLRRAGPGRAGPGREGRDLTRLRAGRLLKRVPLGRALPGENTRHGLGAAPAVALAGAGSYAAASLLPGTGGHRPTASRGVLPARSTARVATEQRSPGTAEPSAPVSSAAAPDHWALAPSPTTATLNAVSCVATRSLGGTSASYCYGVGDHGTILFEKNGLHWVTVPTTPATSDPFEAVACQASGFSCWAVGYAVAAELDPARFPATGWGLITVLGPPGATCGPGGPNKACLRGVAIGTGGEHFAVGGGGNIYAQPATAGQGWMIQTSLGAGSSWLPASSPAAGSLPVLRAVGVLGSSNELAFSVGDNGTVLSTSDRGSTWTRKTSPTRSDLEGLSCPNATSPPPACVAVGQGGTIVVLR